MSTSTRVGQNGQIITFDTTGMQQTGEVRGPFELSWDTPGIDDGVELWTPTAGDHITGLWIEPGEGWDAPDERFGLGVDGTVDNDLAFVFPVPSVSPTARPTFPRSQALGVPLGAEVFRVLTNDPLVIRTLVGGNTQGSMSLYVVTVSA